MGQTGSRSLQDTPAIRAGFQVDRPACGPASSTAASRLESVRPKSVIDPKTSLSKTSNKRVLTDKHSSLVGPARPNETTPLKKAGNRQRRTTKSAVVSPESGQPTTSTELDVNCEACVWSSRVPTIGSSSCCCCCGRLSNSGPNCDHLFDTDRQVGPSSEIECWRGCCAPTAEEQTIACSFSERSSTDYQTFVSASRPPVQRDVELGSATSGRPATRFNVGTPQPSEVSLVDLENSAKTKRRPSMKLARGEANVTSGSARPELSARPPVQAEQLSSAKKQQLPPVMRSAPLSHLRRQSGKCCELACAQPLCNRCDHDKPNPCQSSPTDTAKTCADSSHAPEEPPTNGYTGAKVLPSEVGRIRSELEVEQTPSIGGNAGRGKSDQVNLDGQLFSRADSKSKPDNETTTLSGKVEHCQHNFEQTAKPQEASHLAWTELVSKYGRMSNRRPEKLTMAGVQPGRIASQQQQADSQDASQEPSQRKRAARMRGSCFCHIFCALTQTLFPILGAFENYSLPGDLLTDLTAGFTVAILHIPQGMAYGLLSGVEPIYGLYVSFIPVAVMSLLSKSRHASYGTFAIISMLLVNITNQVRAVIKDEQASLLVANSSSPLVITDNHQPPDAAQSQLNSQLIRQLVEQSANQAANSQQRFVTSQPPGAAFDSGLLVNAGALLDAPELNSGLPSNIEILTCVCLVCGVVHVTMSLLRLGVLSLMFSDQLVSSFTTAGAFQVLTSQLAGLFDMSHKPISDELLKCARIWWQFLSALMQGDFNQTTAILSLASIVFLLAVKELLEPSLRRRFTRLTCLPSELVLMAVLVCCSGYFRLAADHGVKIIGHVPSGLPEPKVPNLELVPYVLKDAIGVALITFAINLSIAQVYAKKFRYELNANQELFALGSANLVGCFFSCFPCASSLSRSSVQSGLNVKSQLSSLFSCLIVFTIVCYFAHILHDLPRSTLSCIIVVALKGILMQVRDFCENWRRSKLDAFVWITTFVSVIVFGVILGLLIGITTSLLMIFIRLLTPSYSIIARLPNTEIYIDKDAFVECEEIEHVKIFRFNSALCYLNRTILKSKIEKLLPSVFEPKGFRAICLQMHAHELDPPVTPANQINYLVIDCSALSYCDYSGAATLIELIDDLADRKVRVLLAACPLKLVDMIERMQRGVDILAHNVYPTISDAIGQVRYLQATGTKPTKDVDANKPGHRPPDATNERASIIDLS